MFCGIIGTLKYFFGPLPEGPAFAPGEPSDEQAAPSGGRPVEATQPPVQQPPKAPAAPAVETAADRARSAAARDAIRAPEADLLLTMYRAVYGLPLSPLPCQTRMQTSDQGAEGR